MDFLGTKSYTEGCFIHNSYIFYFNKSNRLVEFFILLSNYIDSCDLWYSIWFNDFHYDREYRYRYINHGTY